MSGNKIGENARDKQTREQDSKKERKKNRNQESESIRETNTKTIEQQRLRL